jgi:polyketide synthase PksM
MAVDTMCSSSLTTIHLACQSLQQGICELAIAGGVNVSIHPNKYLVLGQARFVSSTGRCESFGKGGDGYVPGEGVGAVLLKPLSKAIADGDHIYGVIKGTAINHGGKTNGYTVPNPNAQAGVIGQALKEAGSDPRTISYIEAHGTGTFLGDPIEITGLVKAFQKYTENKQFCTIGSAKSNIGHCESAAGIAGVTKVLLQLKNRQIAPSLHSEVLNPNIDFLNTPFIVQQQLTEWERPVVTIDGVTREYPRIAGISSFGAGGSNAHIIIEEYIPKSQEQAAVTETPQQPALIILSAKDEERLKEQAERLIAAIRERRLTDANLANSYLADIAYTLQVGREAMEERLGVIAGSTGELIEKLTAFLTGQNGIEDLYRGQVKRNQEALTVFTADEEMQEAIQKWIERKKYGKLLDLWVKGLIFDWNKLYGDQKPRRISLPTYPFAKERYWVPEMKTKRTLAPNSGIATYIHPLLQQNTSDFLEQRFSSTFTGKEFFLADHVVNGQKVLPGVAYLEMVRAAVEAAATGGLANDRMMIKLKNVIWARPIGVGEQPAQVHIGLYPEDDAFSENGSGEINYEIYDATGTEDGMPLVYSQGRAILTTAPELPVLDLKAVQAECGERILQATEVYETYRAMGIEYGPGHRGIEEIYIGPEQVLARLLLPSTITETQEQFVLHPSIMDAALQASIGLETSFEDRYLLEGKGVKPMLPFALEELEIIGRCTSSMWALIRHSEGNNKGDKVRKLDIDLCDDQGHICVRLKGFSSRVLEREIPIASRRRPVSVENTSELQVGTIMLTPAWETVSMKRVETSPTLSDRVVIVGGTKEQKSNIQKQYPNVAVLEIQTSDSIDEITRKLTEYGTINHILWIAPYRKLKSSADEILIKEQNQGVLQVFKIIKALLKLGYGTRELGWSLITNRTQAVHKNDEVNPTHASLSGLAGSMAKEYPDWKIRLMDLETEAWPNFSDIFTLPPDTSGNALAFRGGEWYQQQLIPVQSIPIKQTLYKTGGVYVVIGGAGGIGEAWSEYVIRTYQAQVIWIGRRAKDEAIQAKIDRLATLGPEPQYIAADATKRKALEEAYHEIKQSYLQINGVVHSAIVLLDKSLMNMTEEQFQTVLSAKVDVSVRMAQVFSEEPLDFVMFFSSMESFSKSAGQSNYAAGCTFKDAFAHRLNLEWPSTVKVMNWGYWGNVGIVASKVYQELMAQAGIGSIEPPEAMDALERLLAGPLDQIALMKTIKPLTLEGTNQEKQITIYPESLPSVIGNIDNHPIISD